MVGCMVDWHCYLWESPCETDRCDTGVQQVSAHLKFDPDFYGKRTRKRL